jgi:hypothetical protein
LPIPAHVVSQARDYASSAFVFGMTNRLSVCRAAGSCGIRCKFVSSHRCSVLLVPGQSCPVSLFAGGRISAPGEHAPRPEVAVGAAFAPPAQPCFDASFQHAGGLRIRNKRLRKSRSRFVPTSPLNGRRTACIGGPSHCEGITVRLMSCNRSQIRGLPIQLKQETLNRLYLALLEIRLTALAAYPGRNRF